MAIPQDYIAELSRRTDITDLVGSYVELKRAGRNTKGLCPFHNEKTPSLTLYPDNNSFYCFGCGAGGSAIDFVMRIQNLDFVEAVRFLAGRAGMPLPDEDDSFAKTRSNILAINREAARFYATCLNEEGGQGARAYLRGRGLGDKVIRRFGLGYAPDAFSRLRDHLKGQGYKEDELVRGGVCKQNDKGNVYDTFRDRVIFPIIDLRGNVIAFGGRRMGEGFGPKYLNSPETPVFKKGQGVFALNLAKKSDSKRLILVEGYMDVISLHQAGFTTAIAAMGTALPDEQVKLISGYADEVVICFDGDEAGQKATARAINKFRSTDVKVRVLTLEDAKDPDEFIGRFGTERFEALLEGSGNALEYALLKEKQKHDTTTPDGRAAYIRDALEILAAQAKPVEQDIYAGRLAEETDVSKAAILNQLEGAIQRRRRRTAKEREKRLQQEGAAAAVNLPPAAFGNEKALGIVFAEQQLMAVLLGDPAAFVPLARGRLQPEDFLSPEMGQVYGLLLEMEEKGEWIDLAALSGQVPEKTMSLLGRVLALNHGVEFTPEDVALFLERVEERARQPGKAGEMSPEELKAYFDDLKKKKSQ